MLHIAFVDDAHTFGGAQIALLNGLKVLAHTKQFQLTAIVTNNNAELIEKIKKIDAVNVILCPSAYRANGFLFFLSLASFAKILNFKELQNINYWIINLAGIEFGVACVVLLKKKKRKIFGWLHLSQPLFELMPDVGFAKRCFNAIRDRIANRYLFRLYTRIAVPSLASKEILIKRSRQIPPIEVVYNVNLNEKKYVNIDYSECGSDSLESHLITIVVIGRINFAHKGQDRTVGIALELIKRGVTPFFIFVGDGPDAAKLAANFVSASLESCFRITGWQSDVNPWLQAASVVLIPSRFESLPLVAAEAMAMKKRIVASTLPCFKEVIPDACITNFESWEGFTDAIQHILTVNENKLEKMYAPFLEKFSPDAFVLALKSLLHIDKNEDIKHI